MPSLSKASVGSWRNELINLLWKWRAPVLQPRGPRGTGLSCPSNPSQASLPYQTLTLEARKLHLLQALLFLDLRLSFQLTHLPEAELWDLLQCCQGGSLPPSGDDSPWACHSPTNWPQLPHPTDLLVTISLMSLKHPATVHSPLVTRIRHQWPWTPALIFHFEDSSDNSSMSNGLEIRGNRVWDERKTSGRRFTKECSWETHLWKSEERQDFAVGETDSKWG